MDCNLTYFPNIHRRCSVRLREYDYAQAGLYFITICCQGKECHFYTIKKNQMIFNEFGRIAHNNWVKTPEIRPNVKLHEFVVMPNHIHGIIEIHRRGVLNTPPLNMPAKQGVCNTPLLISYPQ